MRKIDWNLEQVMKIKVKCQADRLSLSPTFRFSYIEVDEEALSQCLIVMAFIIEDYGDDYLSILEKLKNELDNYYNLKRMKEFALHLSQNNSLEKLNQLQDSSLIEPYFNSI
jgi:hypothetical protein